MRSLRVALAQINSTVGDLSGNARKIITCLDKAERQGADLVTFPELAICGYPPEGLLFKPHFIKDNLKSLKEIVNSCGDITAVIGFVDSDKEEIYNAAAIINNRKIAGVYHKMVLPNYGVFDEKRYFKAGERFLIFELGEVRFGVDICEDIWKKEPTELQAKAGSADIIVNISASPYHAGKRSLREEILRRRAKEFKAFVLYNNLIGGQDELVFDGGGMVLNKQGEIIARAKEFKEDLVLIDLKMTGSPTSVKKKTINLIRGELPNEIKPIKLSSLGKKSKFPLPRKRIVKLGRTEEIYQALVLGTKDYVKKNGFHKVVIGLSGGIDSSLTALIATDALGKDNVIALSMPSCYSSLATQRDARTTARNLGIRLIIVPIDEMFVSYLKAVRQEFKGREEDVTEENIQARIRGNILMAFSNKFGWLVLTTGNKSEVSVGYCTLYGDMAGGFDVLKDVPKTLIYKLARYGNRKAERALIPHSVLKKAPSAELRPNQKDGDSLPPYAVLDSILKAYIEENKNFSEIKGMGFEDKTIKKIIRMVDSNEYKRRQGPPGIKITSHAFGRDRRLPITNKYRNF
ncbi:MAG: Glutamine-dependent NAD(+) synthetase [Syntrophomonadaceae bacterium]|nr:Glutamine-dependent NAD(+) synthetase [Bacillota bacterium]